jgi:FtsH-binding integral membrane protein
MLLVLYRDDFFFLFKYLVMDVQMMVGGRYHYEINPEEYIFAALNIYVDIISLFIFILDLIGR